MAVVVFLGDTLDISPPRLSEISLIRRYPNEDIRRLQFQFEDAFKGYISAEAKGTNAGATSSPTQPRFLMRDSKRILLVSNISTQLQLNFDQGLPKDRSLRQILERAAGVMDKAVDNILGHQTRAYSGIIVSWEIKSTLDTASIAKELAELLSARPSDAVSFASTIGYLDQGRFITTELSQYKIAKAEIVPGQSTQFIDIEFIPSSEEGIQIKVDVNTKPQIDKPSLGSFQRLAADFDGLVERFVVGLAGKYTKGLIQVGVQ